MELPKCPSAGCGDHALESIRADTRGYVWAFCSVCARPALVNPHGVVVHQGAGNR